MSCIKSIQRGAGSGNATIRISKVDMSKSVVLVSGGSVVGSSENRAGDINGSIPIGNLTDETTLEIINAVAQYRYYNAGHLISTTLNLSYVWQVIEFA